MPDSFDSYRDLHDYALDESDERWLLEHQKECSFIWSTRQGEPIGVVMMYLAAQGKIWLMVTEDRVRVAAVRRDPRTCVIISSAGLPGGTGKTVTYKGTTEVLAHDDTEVSGWFFRDYAAKMNGEGNAERIEFFRQVLDIPERVVLKFTPYKKITYDGDKMAAITPGSNGKFDDMYK